MEVKLKKNQEESAIPVAEKPKKSLSYQRDCDREMVRGKFHFYEIPGGMNSFVFKKYHGDQVERYDLVDGQIYTIPLGVAKHLNNDCWYAVYDHTISQDWKQTYRVKEKVHRMSFESLEFMDIEDLPHAAGKSVIEVEAVL